MFDVLITCHLFNRHLKTSLYHLPLHILSSIFNAARPSDWTSLTLLCYPTLSAAILLRFPQRYLLPSISSPCRTVADASRNSPQDRLRSHPCHLSLLSSRENLWFEPLGSRKTMIPFKSHPFWSISHKVLQDYWSRCQLPWPHSIVHLVSLSWPYNQRVNSDLIHVLS